MEHQIFRIPIHLVENHWYHVCQSWSSYRGSWNLYLNGKLKSSGLEPQVITIHQRKSPDNQNVSVERRFNRRRRRHSGGTRIHRFRQRSRRWHRRGRLRFQLCPITDIVCTPCRPTLAPLLLRRRKDPKSADLPTNAASWWRSQRFGPFLDTTQQTTERDHQPVREHVRFFRSSRSQSVHQ